MLSPEVRGIGRITVLLVFGTFEVASFGQMSASFDLVLFDSYLYPSNLSQCVVYIHVFSSVSVEQYYYM
jgi:hypothetical protein